MYQEYQKSVLQYYFSRMDENEKRLAIAQYDGFIMALDLLKSRGNFPAYKSQWQSVEDKFGNRAMEWALRTYTAKGEIDKEFTVYFPYTMEFPDAMKSNTRLNFKKAVPSSCWDAVNLSDWTQSVGDALATLSPFYPHIKDIPHIIEREISRITQIVKN